MARAAFAPLLELLRREPAPARVWADPAPAPFPSCVNPACGARASWQLHAPCNAAPLLVCTNCSVLAMMVAMSCGAYPPIEELARAAVPPGAPAGASSEAAPCA